MKRAIGIIRVSRYDDGVSPEIQAERIEDACEREGLRLLCMHRELDVSGGKPLDKRPGLRAAVKAIEAGDAEVVVVAYFDRLVRSLKVQQEVVERVEAAGGEVLTVDVGRLTNGTAAQRLTANFLGSVAQFYREQSSEKTEAAQERAVAGGRFPGPTPLGYRREHGTLVPDSATKGLVSEAFQRRADGASARELRDYLAEHGVDRTLAGVRKMLGSRLYIGEIHYRGWSNLEAHKPIVDRELFERVQRTRVPAGRKGKSERLLARQGILRCGSCAGRMVVGSGTRGAFYRCGNDRCTQRVTIYADPVERRVLKALADYGAAATTTASAGARVDALDAEVERTQAELNAAIQAYGAAGVSTEPSAVERLTELRVARDTAMAARADLGSEPVTRIYNCREIVARGTLLERQDLLRAAGCRAIVKPGRVPDRLQILFEQPPANPV